MVGSPALQCQPLRGSAGRCGGLGRLSSSSGERLRSGKVRCAMGFLNEPLDLFLPSPLVPTAPLLQAAPLSLERPSFIPYSHKTHLHQVLWHLPFLCSSHWVLEIWPLTGTSTSPSLSPLISPCFSSSLTGSMHSSPWALMGAATSSGSHHMSTSDHTALLRLQPLAASCYYAGRWARHSIHSRMETTRPLFLKMCCRAKGEASQKALRPQELGDIKIRLPSHLLTSEPSPIPSECRLLYTIQSPTSSSDKVHSLSLFPQDIPIALPTCLLKTLLMVSKYATFFILFWSFFLTHLQSDILSPQKKTLLCFLSKSPFNPAGDNWRERSASNLLNCRVMITTGTCLQQLFWVGTLLSSPCMSIGTVILISISASSPVTANPISISASSPVLHMREQHHKEIKNSKQKIFAEPWLLVRLNQSPSFVWDLSILTIMQEAGGMIWIS